MKKEITKRASVLFLSMILTVTMISPAGIAKGKTPVLSSKSVSLSVKESTTVKIKKINNVKKLTISVRDKNVVKASVEGKDKAKTIRLTGKKAGTTIVYVKVKADKVYKLDLPVNVAEEVKPLKADRAGFSIWPITDELFYRMQQGNTFKENCIVPREDLRYIQALHKDKEGKVHLGEMVVHEVIAEDVLEILEKLYDASYPIERMVLPDNYMADDETMMRDNNSSSFNFRFISHTTKLSKHGMGMAVDINTLYNPYHKIVQNEDGTTEEVIEPATGAPYLDRTKDFDYKINKGDLCYQLFMEKGFEWGGDWTDRKDYQHFELPTSITDVYAEKYQSTLK